MGVEVGIDAVLTSSEASATFLHGRLEAGVPVMVVGEGVLRQAIVEAGFSLASTAGEAQAVVVGLDRQATWSSLTEAALAVRRGALFIAANPDVTFPIERGLALGSGALVAAIQAATGVEPMTVGKPEPHLYTQALARLDAAPEETLAIGDRLETDILKITRGFAPPCSSQASLAVRTWLARRSKPIGCLKGCRISPVRSAASEWTP
jgi:4-nitrophenyl phosphatase